MRLDKYLTENKIALSREKAQEMIKQGFVIVNEKVALKASFDVCEDDKIVVNSHKEYVSRGAYKLLGAIDKFKLNFKDKVVLDAGASTGGFTQVALENGAKKVYSVDVGKNELNELLALDARVVNMAGRDIRSLEINEVKDVDIIVGDLSFISLTHILPVFKSLFGKPECVLLLKPQFECGKEIAKKFKGVINDEKVHKEIIENFKTYCQSIDFVCDEIVLSPIKGKSGNTEYLVHLNKSPNIC